MYPVIKIYPHIYGVFNIKIYVVVTMDTAVFHISGIADAETGRQTWCGVRDASSRGVL